MFQRRVVIVGGRGRTGRRVEAGLRARAVDAVALSRSTRPAFDWDAPATWPAALHGATAAYVTHQPGLAAPRAADDIAAFAGIAAEMGVEHAVLLSIRGERRVLRAEDRLRRAALDHTILRASFFAENFSEGPLLDGIIAGDVALPARRARAAFVSVDDIAEAAVEALCDVRHLNRTYEITGPRALRFADALAEIAAASGRKIRLRDGAPPLPLRGGGGRVARDAERILGRKPVDFADYVRQAGEAGTWAR